MADREGEARGDGLQRRRRAALRRSLELAGRLRPSESRALAALENLVHLNPPVTFQYVAIPVEFDDGLMETIARRTLPADWTEEPPPPSTKAIGDWWVKEGRSAVLEVPSVIVPGEANFLLNPGHRDFRKIRMGKAEPFAFDPRLI